ncbi:MAG TPA: alpha/beta hydrolase [Polyangiaceae bacterium]|jgi:pimeloyl-ACP methyl ester carboxylesterase
MRAATNGVELEYEIFGRPSDPPMVLIMGLSMQMIAWDDPFCADLAGRGFRVIRFDNRDVGLSTHLVDKPAPDIGALLAGDYSSAAYSLDDMARDTVGLLDVLDIPSAHFVGVSMGGMIAQCIAINHPARVRSLASIMSTTGDPNVGHAKPEVLGALLTPPPFERDAYLAHGLGLWRLIGSPGFPFDEAATRELVGRSFDRSYDPIGAARQIAAIAAAPDRTAALANVKVPTLVIHGAEDPLIAPSGGEATARAIPGAELIVIPGMGHNLSPEVWPRVIDALVANARR